MHTRAAPTSSSLLLGCTAIVVLTLTSPEPARAAVIDAASCSTTDVQAAIDGASAGDEIVLPACSATWSVAVVVDRPVTIRGAGEAATLLTGGGAAFFDVDIDATGLVRFTGMEMRGAVDGEAISINGRAQFRVDHCRFVDITGRSIFLGYQNWATADMPAVRGLVDHITYEATDSLTPIMVYGRDDAWLRGEGYGTDDAVFVEDSTFDFATPGVNSSVLDGEHGARFVVRHNTIVNGEIQQHDTGSTPQGRGTRAIEVYANTFECHVADCGNSVFGIRGGTGLIYDNVIPAGYVTPTFTQIYRVTDDGSSPWSSRCDATPERVCGTFFSHCSGGDHHTCFDDTECSGAGTCVDTCTVDGDCPAGAGCVALDGQLEASGWPCRDQTGRGADDPVTHVQSSAPLYWWNNTAPGGMPYDLYVASVNAPFIQENRDYCNHAPTTACGGTAPFDYTPFPYPHPLATGAPLPDGGMPTDGGARGDAATSTSDAGTRDAGTSAGPPSSGCGCRAGGPAPLPRGWPSALWIALAVAWSQRRSRRR